MQEDVYFMLLSQYLGKNPNADEKDFLLHQIELRSPDSIENIQDTPLNEVNSNIRYFKIKLDRLPSKNKTNSKKKSLPYQIALLNELGYFELEKFKNLPKDKVYEITARLLNSDKRSVKGNHAVLNPISKENTVKFTSHIYMEAVKKYLNSI
jgi:hypothetical protein